MQQSCTRNKSKKWLETEFLNLVKSQLRLILKWRLEHNLLRRWNSSQARRPTSKKMLKSSTRLTQWIIYQTVLMTAKSGCTWFLKTSRCLQIRSPCLPVSRITTWSSIKYTHYGKSARMSTKDWWNYHMVIKDKVLKVSLKTFWRSRRHCTTLWAAK